MELNKVIAMERIEKLIRYRMKILEDKINEANIKQKEGYNVR